MKVIGRLFVTVSLLLLVGCAHPINIAPNMAAFDGKQASKKVSKQVAYYISAEDRAKEVTTPGGGGDKVTYFPYRDLEPAIYKMLSNNFDDVHVLKSMDDKTELTSKKIAYVFVPKIETMSSSSSMLTWPPTDFTVSLECRALSPSGAVLWQTAAKGEGKATFSEFKADFSLAGRRAGERAVLQFEQQLRSSPLAR